MNVRTLGLSLCLLCGVCFCEELSNEECLAKIIQLELDLQADPNCSEFMVGLFGNGESEDCPIEKDKRLLCWDIYSKRVGEVGTPCYGKLPKGIDQPDLADRERKGTTCYDPKDVMALLKSDGRMVHSSKILMITMMAVLYGALALV